MEEEILTQNYISSVTKRGDTITKRYHNTTQEFTESQVETLRFLEDKIRVPKVLRHWYDGSDGYIEMEYIDGFHPQRDSVEYQKALLSVKNLEQYQGSVIGNIFTNKVTDCFMSDPNLRPARSFMELVCNKLECDIERTKSMDPIIHNILKGYKQEITDTCPTGVESNIFVHNDLNTRNVIIRNGDFYIIDWDYSGYYPKVYCDIKNTVYKQDYISDSVHESYKVLGKLFRQLQRYQAPKLTNKSKKSIRKSIIKMLGAECPSCGSELPVSANVCSCGYGGHADSDSD